MSSYRIVCKWWTYHVYKIYPDGREFIIDRFATQEQAEDFIKSEKGREQ